MGGREPWGRVWGIGAALIAMILSAQATKTERG